MGALKYSKSEKVFLRDVGLDEKWLQTVSSSQAIKDVGFFGNQNTVRNPTDNKWTHTVERIKNLLLNEKRAA